MKDGKFDSLVMNDKDICLTLDRSKMITTVYTRRNARGNLNLRMKVSEIV